MGETFKLIMPYLTGGARGAIITLCVNWFRNRVKTMQCKYVDDEVLSKLPIKQEDGIEHSNIYCKHFELSNTTGSDIEKFTIVFQFDSTSTILEYNNITKSGANKHSMKRTQVNPNECKATITNFIRKDTIRFTFKIANVTNGEYYITEDDCIKFKIKHKDCRKKKLETKAKRATNVLTTTQLKKAEDE